MKTLFILYAFAMGICIGSFLNVLIYRMPLHLNVAKGRSFCPSCKHQLGAIDLVPLFSYLFLGAKCRYCKNPISARYFIIELITGILYASIVCIYYPSYQIFLYCLIFSILIVISLIDYAQQYIPNILIIIIACSTLLYIGLFEMKDIFSYLLSAIFAASPFILSSIIAHLFKKQGFGMGDIKLAFALGLSIPLSSLTYVLLLTLICLLVKLSVTMVLPQIYKKSDKFNVKNPFACADVLSATYIIYIITYSI